jgi:hypothetical protein
MPQEGNTRFPKCRLCKSNFHYKHVDLEMPFRCPLCGQWLRVAHSYWYKLSGALAAMVISGLTCFKVGSRGANLVLYTLLLTIPAMFIVVFWRMHFAPPTLEPSSPPLGTDILGLNK